MSCNTNSVPACWSRAQDGIYVHTVEGRAGRFSKHGLEYNGQNYHRILTTERATLKSGELLLIKGKELTKCQYIDKAYLLNAEERYSFLTFQIPDIPNQVVYLASYPNKTCWMYNHTDLNKTTYLKPEAIQHLKETPETCWSLYTEADIAQGAALHVVGHTSPQKAAEEAIKLLNKDNPELYLNHKAMLAHYRDSMVIMLGRVKATTYYTCNPDFLANPYKYIALEIKQHNNHYLTDPTIASKYREYLIYNEL